MHPLQSLTLQGKQMVPGLLRTDCPRAQLLHRCEREEGGMGVRKAETLGSSGLSHPSAQEW